MKSFFCNTRGRYYGKPLQPAVEAIKKHANEVFELQNYSQAIHLYNQAIHMAPDLPILYGNRAAAYLKRNWLASEFYFTNAVCPGT